jgi:5-methylcytosine-specific restriction endonuclease McrA
MKKLKKEREVKMIRELTSWSIEEITKLIKLNPATLETYPETKIKVNIEYQRGVIYSSEKQGAIIESILKDFAIPSIVLWRNIDDNTYDVIDGKQRLTSIFLFISGNLQIKYIGNQSKYFSELSESDKLKVKNYKVPFIIMSGTKNEEHFKHELFEILNITAESLNNWELLQGSYYGNFLNSFKLEIQDANNVEIQNEFNFRDKSMPAKARYAGCYKLLSLHIGSDKEIKDYVSKNREKSGSDFYKKEIKKILIEASKLPEPKNINIYYEIIREILNSDSKYRSYITNKSEIVLKLKNFYAENVYTRISGNNLKIVIYNIFGIECGFVKIDPKRNFTEIDKENLFKIQDAKRSVENKNQIRCPNCGKLFHYKQMHLDHIIPHSLGGRTELVNAQFLCDICNKSKGAK